MDTYDSRGNRAVQFIHHGEIEDILDYGERNRKNRPLIRSVLEKASTARGLSPREAMALLDCEEEDLNREMIRIAQDLKERFYGNRIVLFAPLYLSNYCVNGCSYCPYNSGNRNIVRKRLTMEEIAAEVTALQDMGHKRLAVETGEDPEKCPIDYVVESIRTIYGVRHRNGRIRRVNVNIAAAAEAEYRQLKEAGIGTYILFQETYHKETYEKLHPWGPKSDYAWHTEAMDRAMEAGIDDVGIGVLFGLNLYRYDFAGLLLHAIHLEKTFGCGPHTVSVPRIRPADGVDPESFENAIPDPLFTRLIAVLRLAVPYTGIIMSTREDPAMRAAGLAVGVSQISGGSRTSVGGYLEEEPEEENSKQFEVSDRRSLDQVVAWLIGAGHIPSFCTACYREGRTGDRFMKLVKEGQIANVCGANALLTLEEYLEDYASPETKAAGERLLARELERIPREKDRKRVEGYLEQIRNGQRDFRL